MTCPYGQGCVRSHGTFLSPFIEIIEDVGQHQRNGNEPGRSLRTAESVPSNHRERKHNEAKVFPGRRFFAVSNKESDQNKPKINRKRRTERHARSDQQECGS